MVFEAERRCKSENRLQQTTASITFPTRVRAVLNLGGVPMKRMRPGIALAALILAFLTPTSVRAQPSPDGCWLGTMGEGAARDALLAAATTSTDGRVRSPRRNVLAIDTTRNGGGTDWAGIAPRLLTDKHLECPPFASIKHPLETKRLERRLARLEEELEADVPHSKLHQLLEDARRNLLADRGGQRAL